ncbi:unnamed protein product [Heterobilharzia americana]|nr:unnamed protein product [Heterobilharzia americana]
MNNYKEVIILTFLMITVLSSEVMGSSYWEKIKGKLKTNTSNWQLALEWIKFILSKTCFLKEALKMFE